MRTPRTLKSPVKPIFAAVLAVAGAAALAPAPAAAQDVDEVVIMGRYGPGGPSQLSQTVSLRDLDLTTYAGQAVMRERVRYTARDLCRALGESSGPGAGGPLVPTCADQAVRNARPQMRMAVNQAFAVRQAYAYLDVPNPYPWLD